MLITPFKMCLKDKIVFMSGIYKILNYNLFLHYFRKAEKRLLKMLGNH